MTQSNAAIETILEPELPICDPHHHLWDFPGARYFLEELTEDISGGHNIVSTVFVECNAKYRTDGPLEMQPVGETEFVQGIADQSATGKHGPTAVAAGIVGFADLTLGDAVAPVLEAQIEAGKNRFRGIRHISAWDANPDMRSFAANPALLLEPKFRQGFACLRKYDLSFDAWLYHTQIMELVDLAKAFPETSIILDHVGGPIGIGSYANRRQQVFREWQQAITALAACPNVFVKLGGLGMPLCGFGWHELNIPPGSAKLADAMAPYYLWCIERFGTDRCMFESNFPVDKVAYSCNVMWNAFKRISRDFSPAERANLFHDTAARAYRLGTEHKK